MIPWLGEKKDTPERHSNSQATMGKDCVGQKSRRSWTMFLNMQLQEMLKLRHVHAITSSKDSEMLEF